MGNGKTNDRKEIRNFALVPICIAIANFDSVIP